MSKVSKESKSSKANNSYDIKSLEILSPRDHCRLRKGMYVGDAEDPSSIFNEIYDNAIDEQQAGYSKITDIVVNYDDNTYQVTDYGRGFPQGKVHDPSSGKDIEALELLCTTAFSGGKFNSSVYRFSGGLNGVGLLVTNSLSDSFSVKTWRGKNVVEYSAEKGITKSVKTYKDKDSKDSGTSVTIKPDPEMFTSDVIPLSHILMRCRTASAFDMKSTLTVIKDGVAKQEDTESGIYDLLPPLDEGISEYYTHYFTVKDKKSGEFAAVALQYTSDTKSYYRGYTNLLYNPNGGSHHRLLDDALSDAWSKFKLDGLKPNDIYLGLRGVIAIFISNPEFSSQTKEKLSVPKARLEELRALIAAEIYKWLKSNDSIRESLIKRFKEFRESQNKLLSRKEIKSLLQVNSSKNGTIERASQVRKLRECESKLRNGTELFIVEGDSAVGSAVQARDPKTQAVIPVRGKVFNVARCTNPKDALVNEETRAIVNVIGAGIGEDTDPAKSRYERIIFMADADEDGKEIAVLLTGMFVNLLPNLVKQGMVYLALPPLYGWEDKKGYHFTNKQSDIPVKDYHRYKGLGEMDPDELKESTMNPMTRRLVKVEYPEDINTFNSILMSSAVKFQMLEDQGVIRSE